MVHNAGFPKPVYIFSSFRKCSRLIAECFSGYGSEFHTIGANIRKLSSPNFVRVREIKRLPRVAERRLVPPGASVTGAQKSPKYAGPMPCIQSRASMAILYLIRCCTVEDIAENWGDVAKLSRINESRSSVQNHLKSLNFSFRVTV